MEPVDQKSPQHKIEKSERYRAGAYPDRKPRSWGSRLFTWFVIAVAFILLDIAILLYFIWGPPASTDVDLVRSAPTEIEKNINETAASEGMQQKR